MSMMMADNLWGFCFSLISSLLWLFSLLNILAFSQAKQTHFIDDIRDCVAKHSADRSALCFNLLHFNESAISIMLPFVMITLRLLDLPAVASCQRDDDDHHHLPSLTFSTCRRRRLTLFITALLMLRTFSSPSPIFISSDFSKVTSVNREEKRKRMKNANQANSLDGLSLGCCCTERTTLFEQTLTIHTNEYSPLRIEMSISIRSEASRRVPLVIESATHTRLRHVDIR